MTKVLKQKEHTGHWIFVHPLQENAPGAYICWCYGWWRLREVMWNEWEKVCSDI